MLDGLSFTAEASLLIPREGRDYERDYDPDVISECRRGGGQRTGSGGERRGGGGSVSSHLTWICERS